MDGRRSRQLALSFLVTAVRGIAPARADEVTDWNVTVADVLTLAGQNTIVMTRGLAMAHLATHDALNAIDRRYEPYLSRSLKNFSQAQEEDGDSRVYSEIHFRNSTVAGITQGEQIGRQAFAQYLQPYRP
jgi:hypothetical protein